MTKRFGFTYIFCNDLGKMKGFYSEMLRLKLVWESKDSIAYRIGDHQLSIIYNEQFLPPISRFSIQIGWEGGIEARTSWSLECPKEDFNLIVESILNSDVPKYFDKPTWKGYWSFPVLDPMNNTI